MPLFLPPIGIVALGLGGSAHQMLTGMPFRLAPEFVDLQRSGGKKYQRVDWTQFPRYMRPEEDEYDETLEIEDDEADGIIQITVSVASRDFAIKVESSIAPDVSIAVRAL